MSWCTGSYDNAKDVLQEILDRENFTSEVTILAKSDGDKIIEVENIEGKI